MLAILVGLLIGTLLLVTAVIVSRQRSTLDQCLCHLTKKVARRTTWAGSLPATQSAVGLLNPLYDLIRAGIRANDAKTTYQAVALLKKCASVGGVGIDEAYRLKGLVLQLLKNRQPETASQVLDIISLAITRAQDDGLHGAVRQLTIIGLASLKEKENFLASKAIDAIHSILLRQTVLPGGNCVPMCLQGIKVIGLFALHRHDTGLFREINVKLAEWAVAGRSIEATESLTIVLLAWLNYTVVSHDMPCLEIWIDSTSRILDSGTLPLEVTTSLLQEWMKLAGVAALNPEGSMAPLMIAAGLRQAGKTENLRTWILTLSAAGLVVAMVINRYDLQQAFPVLYPLLDAGRLLLKKELKFGGEGYADSYRQQALLLIAQENLIVAKLLARQDMIRTVDEIIADILRCWLAYPPACYTRKQARKYCQLLHYYWRQNSTKNSREDIPAVKELTEPMLLSLADRQQLKFLAPEQNQGLFIATGQMG